ncbi:ABC transporter substrate-binding protein [Burkholderia cepacia]|uniref:ABC transporter substrate-binding protein n=1 Tax=Burkholderia cepacia TaxID=292 RepID=UPI002AB796F4|nr:ABC transporter substrate-binding protein [Burkholderia cepacia]
MKTIFMLLVSVILFGNFVDARAKPLEVIVFPGGFNWPVWVAQDKGFFDEKGISVHVTPTPSSSYQMENLINGKYDIAMTAVDNLIAYREGQGERPIIGRDLVAVMGGDSGFLKLVASPDTKTIGDLRGKNVSVDSPASGYAFVLYEILKRNGLEKSDYVIQEDGGVLRRFHDLMARKQDATLLVSPFELKAQEQGFNVLADALDVLGQYQGLVAGVRESWANQHKRELEAYIGAYITAVEWLFDSRNKEQAIAIFQKNVGGDDRQAAENAYVLLLRSHGGIQPYAKLDAAGLDTVLKLRMQWAGSNVALKAPSHYYDPRFYNEALVSVRNQ